MSLVCRFIVMSAVCMNWSVYPTSFAEVYTVFSRYMHEPAQVGEIAPISQAAGNELARFLCTQDDNLGKRYLEIGGGCGAVSVCLARNLRTNDHLDVVEIDPKMYLFLCKRLAGYSNVSVHCCSILDWKPQEKYDVIVSTLPFNSLGAEFTQNVLQHIQAIASQKCMFSYVEYPIVRQVLQHFYGAQRRNQFLGVQQILKSFRDLYLQGQRTVYLNVPPVTIYHLCL